MRRGSVCLTGGGRWGRSARTRGRKEVREPWKNGPGSGIWAKEEGIVLALKDVYQEVQCTTHRSSFVGFCKMKMEILENYGSSLIQC